MKSAREIIEPKEAFTEYKTVAEKAKLYIYILI